MSMSSLVDILWGPHGLIFLGVVLAAAGAVWSARQQAVFERELATRTQETKDLLSGGDSFCRVSLGVGDGTRDVGDLRLIHEGEYPLYNVKVKIIYSYSSVDGRIQMLSKEMGELNPQDNLPLGKIELPTEVDEAYYIVIVSARNGVLQQKISIKRIDGAWRTATRVYRDLGSEAELLYENASPGVEPPD